MVVHILMSLLAVQQPGTPPPSPIAKVEVQPSGGEVQVGGTLQFRARALDAAGQVVPRAEIVWYVGGFEGRVDSVGVFTGGYQGYARVTAVGFIRGQPGSQVFGEALVHVLPEPPASIAFEFRPTRLVAGSRLTLVATPFSKHGDRRSDAVAFTSSNPRVAAVSSDGRVRAVAPGRATITATAGPATETLPVQVLPNTVARLVVEPAAPAVRTGDVVQFSATPRTAAGRSLGDIAVAWSVAAGSGIAEIDPAGAFVAELPGTYTVTATVGGRTADAVVRATARRVGRGIEVRGRVPIAMSAAEVWVHPSGTCAYLSTIADRVYSIDITDVTHPRIVDSMVTDARIVNDVMTTEDGKLGVFSREGASNRKNGIVVFDASDPCHPKVVSEYTETVSGGVHSSYVYQGHAYITDDATGSLRVIDFRDPAHPKEVARWQAEQTEGGQPDQSPARVAVQVRLERRLRPRRAVVGAGLRARHPYCVAPGEVRVRGRRGVRRAAVQGTRRRQQSHVRPHARGGRVGPRAPQSSRVVRADRRRRAQRVGGGRHLVPRELPGRRSRARRVGRAEGRPVAPGAGDQLDPHGRLPRPPATRAVRLGSGRARREYLCAGHQYGALDP